MTKEELLEFLKSCAEDSDNESAHSAADEALLRYIDDPEITAAYTQIEKWYA